MSQRSNVVERPYSSINIAFMQNEVKVEIRGFESLNKARIDRGVHAVMKQYHLMRKGAIRRDRMASAEEKADAGTE